MKIYRPVLTLLVAAIAVLGCWRSPGQKPRSSTPASNAVANTPKNAHGKFTISKETTYITEPLDKDGYPDYVTALNTKMCTGVSPQKDSISLLWKAIGPRPDGWLVPKEYFRWLEIEAPPEKGEYFVDLKHYLKDQSGVDAEKLATRLELELVECGKRPWKPSEHPQLDAWLKANERPLALVAAAEWGYLSPLVPEVSPRGRASILGTRILLRVFRELAKALAARAMLYTSQGDQAAAWRDLLACHNIGRMVRRGATQIELLNGFAVDKIAAEADLAFLASAKPDAKQLEICLQKFLEGFWWLDGVDPVPNGERFLVLDELFMIDRHGISYLEGLAGADTRGVRASPLQESFLEDVDWDPALRNINRWFDRIDALCSRTRIERVKQTNQIEADLRALKEKVLNEWKQAVIELGDERGRWVGDNLICLMMPGLPTKWMNAADRAQQISNNVLIAFALEWYQREHGHYPKELQDLAPEYLSEVQLDIFSGKPLIYRPNDNGYLLYSVGVDGKDDGGRGPDDMP